MKKKVLVVDDSKMICMVVNEMLTKIGMECDSAMDGVEAVEKLASGNSYDYVLLDWNMPNMNGEEFLVKNKEEKIVSCPILMMTTENKPEQIAKAIELGVSEYIMKPFTEDILESKLRMVDGGNN